MRMRTKDINKSYLEWVSFYSITNFKDIAVESYESIKYPINICEFQHRYIPEVWHRESDNFIFVHGIDNIIVAVILEPAIERARAGYTFYKLPIDGVTSDIAVVNQYNTVKRALAYEWSLYLQIRHERSEENYLTALRYSRS